MSSLKGKVAIVTGGSRGQGLVEATLFAERGASVAICDVLKEEGESAAEELRRRELDVRFVTLDVTSSANWDSLVDDVLKWKSRIDILVNNAGILNRKTISTYAEADWQRVIGVNLTGTFLGIQKVTPHMCGQGRGAIVNIGSNAALSGHADPAYTASKWGIRGLTKSAALEFATFNVRVNCVCPGLVVTDINRGAKHLEPMINMTPMGRPVEAHEVAALVAFLAGDEAGMITGEEIVIDGGFIAGAGYWKIATEAGHYQTKR